jgi:putative SOS response-associated peptidase YedK
VQRQALRDIFGVEPPPGEWKAEAGPGDLTPIVRANPAGGRESVLATFGLVPRSRVIHGAKDFQTMNVRSECVGDKRSSCSAWHRSQLCLVPAVAIYEPSYIAGQGWIRYRIELVDEPALGIAGLWKHWPDGSHSFAMFTVSASGHAVMKLMHAPGKEKRGVVMIPHTQWDVWLTCRDPELARSFMTLYPAEKMIAVPAPVMRHATENPGTIDMSLPS